MTVLDRNWARGSVWGLLSKRSQSPIEAWYPLNPVLRTRTTQSQSRLLRISQALPKNVQLARDIDRGIAFSRLSYYFLRHLSHQKFWISWHVYTLSLPFLNICQLLYHEGIIKDVSSQGGSDFTDFTTGPAASAYLYLSSGDTSLRAETDMLCNLYLPCHLVQSLNPDWGILIASTGMMGWMDWISSRAGYMAFALFCLLDWPARRLYSQLCADQTVFLDHVFIYKDLENEGFSIEMEFAIPDVWPYIFFLCPFLN